MERRETESKDGIFGCFFQHMGIKDEKGLRGCLANRAEEDVETQYDYLGFPFICPPSSVAPCDFA